MEYKNHKICEQCAYSFDIHIDASGKYLGCGCSPYKGKWVAEIEMCPLDKWSSEELLNFIAKERMINSQYGTVEDDKAYEKVMEALEKVEQLEKENKKLREKQIPKKPKKVTLDTYDFTTYYVCPTCNTHDRGCKAPYCRWCGQKLDWDE